MKTENRTLKTYRLVQTMERAPAYFMSLEWQQQVEALPRETTLSGNFGNFRKV
jgi:hypothetical protein